MGEELWYTVLVYEDECGLWLKIPELGCQCCTEEVECGLEFLEEELDSRLALARKHGEEVPERRVRTVRRVGKREYGLTQAEIDRKRYRQELLEEERARREPIG